VVYAAAAGKKQSRIGWRQKKTKESFLRSLVARIRISQNRQNRKFQY